MDTGTRFLLGRQVCRGGEEWNRVSDSEDEGEEVGQGKKESVTVTEAVVAPQVSGSADSEGSGEIVGPVEAEGVQDA